VQITVESLAVADELAESLLSAGYPRIEQIDQDFAPEDAKVEARSTVDRYDHDNDPALWSKRIHGSADPGRPTNVHIRVDGWPNQQFALLFVDWLTADAAARADYLSVKRAAEEQGGGDGAAYVAVKEPWFLDAYRRAWEWADATGWKP
jgi:dephospho-CoA kinase